MHPSGFYDVSEARPRLRDLMEEGGGAILTIGSEYRLLMHIPAIDRTHSPLPWPLSLIGRRRRCSLQIYQLLPASGTPPITKRGPLIRERDYTDRSEMATAIEHFLDGAQPDDAVHITIGISN